MQSIGILTETRMNNQAKWVVLTGATRGIGRGIARQVAKEGYDLILPVRDIDSAAGVVQEIEGFNRRVVLYRCDLARPEHVTQFADTMLQEHGAPWGFISCAGMTCDGLSFQLDLAKVQQTFQVNLFSTMQLVGKLAMPMGRAGGGRMVLVSSVSAWLGNRGNAPYAATKGGLQAFMKSVLEEFSRRGLTINSVLPGFIATDMTGGRDEWLEKMAKRIPAQRVGTVADVANAVSFLLAESSGFINGAELAVDGGMSATLGLY
jgi:3-oxoacyl-[acyl-carrier protein] reductase